MDRIDGETIPRRILREPQFAPARAGLASQCGAVLARIHDVPWRDLGWLRRSSAEAELAHYAHVHHAGGTPRPVFEWAMRWLREHLPAPVEPRLVHGDFRNGNLIVGVDGLRAVLDWELAHVGDPMEDLGWICVNSWRFGQTITRSAASAPAKTLFAAYEANGAARSTLRACSSGKCWARSSWGVMCGQYDRGFATGSDRSVERAVIGRRASETEIDLLRLLAPEPRAMFNRSPPPSSSSRPSRASCATRPCPPSTLAKPSWRACRSTRWRSSRANWRRARAPDRAERARVQALLTGGAGTTGESAAGLTSPPCATRDDGEPSLAALNARLCEEIAAGRIARDDPALLAHLRATMLAAVAIDQPGYSGLRLALSAAPAHRTAPPETGEERDDGLQSARRPGRLSRRTRPLHRSRDQAAGAGRRQHPLLRSPPRMGAHRFRQRRPAAAGMGSAAGASAPPSPTRPATGASRCRRNTAARTARTSGWR